MNHVPQPTRRDLAALRSLVDGDPYPTAPSGPRIVTLDDWALTLMEQNQRLDAALVAERANNRAALEVNTQLHKAFAAQAVKVSNLRRRLGNAKVLMAVAYAAAAVAMTALVWWSGK